MILRICIILLVLANSVFGGQVVSTPTTYQANVDFTTGLVLDFGSNRLRNIANPISNNDAASKFYVDTVVGGGIPGPVWGGITGTLSDQADLQAALDAKENSLTPGDITSADDTNVTLTLGGDVTGAVINSAGVSFTLGWTGVLPQSRGGTGATTTLAHYYFGNNSASSAPPDFHPINFNELLGVATPSQAGLPIGGATGQILQKTSGADYNASWVTPASVVITGSIVCVFDGSGGVVSGGADFYISVPYTGTITEAVLLGDQSGSIIIEVRKCTFAQFDAGATHPVAGDKINSFTPPTLSSSSKSSDTSLSGWTTGFSAGDVFGFHVNGTPTAIKRATLVLKTVR